MVAALQLPPETFAEEHARAIAHQRERHLRTVPDHAVRGEAVRVRPVSVRPVPDAVPAHRQHNSPRVTRSHGAAVYWRRRFVAAALGLGVLLTAAHAGAALGGSTTTSPERSPHVLSVVVRPGDTLWTIAERLDPKADPRAVVDALVSARGTSSVQAGQLITWAK
jgi:nucleoid-associated protein YgaU